MVPEVKLVWITPNCDDVITYCARVSSPKNQFNKATAPKLLKYLLDHKHVSPFEMASACMEITTSRDIGRQILRHRSFSFQEFSGRYQVYPKLHPDREARLQDLKNRQNSLPCPDTWIVNWWRETQEAIAAQSLEAYSKALEWGIAKEQARAILPEGLTPTRMYMSGTIRSWIHYWEVRGDDAQREHRDVARLTKEVLLKETPILRELISPEPPPEAAPQVGTP